MLQTPGGGDLPATLSALREWQDDAAAFQLHPGDVGWFWRFGTEATAAALRTWRRGNRILAAGLLDGSALLRLTIAPDALQDAELADQLHDDLTDPARGVLPAGNANVEAPVGALFKELLAADGWVDDEPWTPLRYDLAEWVPEAGVRIEVVSPDCVGDRVAVQRASFDNSTFTEQRWHAMAAGPPHADARCLLAYDEDGNAVAAVTVWSAGSGRPGLVEPMGVHRDHRRRGYGTAVCVAAAAALRELGSSSAVVCTPSANVAGVATYAAAGFQPLPEVRDQRRSIGPAGDD